LCQQFPHKRTRIDDLKRFGGHISLIGIEGLYRLLKAKTQELNILLIHYANPVLRKMKMRAKIDRKVKGMESQGMSEKEISEQIGIMIYDILYEPQEPLAKKISQPNSGDDSKGRDPVGHKSDGCMLNKETHCDNCNSKTQLSPTIASRTYKPIGERVEAFIQKVPPLKPFAKKKELNAKEIEELYNLGEELQDAFQKFWIPFCVAIKK